MPTKPAVLQTARLNNFRLGYLPAALIPIRATRVHILIAGVESRARVRRGSVTIRDILNDAPNTASLTVQGTAPTAGEDLRITINSDTPRLLFHGTLETVDKSYEGKPTQTVWRCTAIDDIERLNRLRPFGEFTNVSATTVAQALVTNFAPGFTANGVQASLPVVTITFDGQDTFIKCLARLATLIGGYCNVEDLDVALFQTASGTPPDPIDVSHPFLHDPPITLATDDSQLRTRQYGKGHGEAVPVDVLANETIVPLVDAVMFNVLGGRAIAGTTPDGAQAQRLTYTGIRLGGAGSLVGAGGAPSVAPTLTLASGSGLGTGVYQYAYTDVTAAGESLPSPLGTITTQGPLADPAVAPTASPYPYGAANSALTVGATYRYQFTYGDATHQTLPSPASTGLVATVNAFGFAQSLQVSGWAYTPGVLINLYRSVNGGTYRLLPDATNISSGTSTYQDFTYSDAAIAGNATTPGSNTMLAQTQVALSAIAIGASGTTSRKVYRTAVNGSQLKLQQTISNNTATVGVTDSTADGSLGANAPTTDTSGLVVAGGQVLAGAASVPTSSGGPFSSVGGWAQTGTQFVRYTGISGNTLTGVPASGAGAILTTVPYGAAITPVPSLVGVGGLTAAMQKGAKVHVWVQRDDLSGQAAQAVIDTANGRTPADGVYEGPPIVDERRGETSLIALCDAHLGLFSRPIQTVTYATRDVKTKSGQAVVVNLANPAISATLTIQDVTITELDVVDSLAPRFSTTASSVRFSLEDLLRQMATALGT